MENVNILTSYLNPKKYTATSNFKKEYHLVRIDSDFLDENQNILSENVTKILRNELPITYGLNGGFSLINIEHPLVVTRDGDNIDYYFQRERDGITKYLSLEHALLLNTNESHFLPYNHLTFIPIDLQFIHYYHIEEQKIYSVEIALPEITLFGHKTLDYNPKHLGGLTSGTHELNYKNAAGYTNVPIEIIIGELLMEQSREEFKKRIVNVNLYLQAGKVYWYPKIRTEQGKITLYYEYHKILNDHFEIPFTDGRLQPAIKLVFNYIEGFLAFMQLTYFTNGVSLLDLWEGSGFRKKDFFADYVEIILEYLKLNEDHIYGILTILYYVPTNFFIKEQKLFKQKGTDTTILGEEFIWSCIDNVLKIPISNYATNVEDITLKLFEILELIQAYKGYKDKEKNDHILNELLRRRFKGQSYLLAFYDRMNTSSFVKYNYLIYKIWRNSSYINPEKSIYKETTYLTKLTDIEKKDKQKPPRMLAYETDKVIGFYTSDINTEFDEKENIVFTPDASWLDDGFRLVYGKERARGITAFIEGDWEITYHPLYPIFLPNPSDKSAIQVQKVSPALLIKASEDKAFWSNVGTTVSYTFDILTTLSGVGNLAKFRHLARIADAAGYLKNGIKLKNTFYVYKAAKGTLAAVEISSGTINILLRITGLDETPFGQALTNFLFWMEMLTLSVDLTDAISGGLKTNAKILSTVESDKLSKILDDLVAAKQIDEADKVEVLGELQRIATKNKKAKSIWHVNRDFYTGEIKSSLNCANCAIAVDRILAGFPTSAVPYTIRKRWKNGKFINTASYDTGTYLTVLEKEFGKKFILDMPPKKIRETLKNGQRGIVYGKVNGRSIGHVFNAVNDNGVIKFLDGQTGKKANLIYDTYQFLPTNF
ncbi:hypothetical protein H2O64_05855 [Kordia sp. YSTF-M3]|uniref:Tox-PL domain-containing protein n=1 Tax=Kordia aestuariivivens TaxID=2759037 RepID=A0ABR7Q6J2_9FLAO|nr:toxin glutamine deamidase domain-containing protein [Kordia aestuariivivens]MBC8754187.1 hypothetical protein [Kordia aestuariivivens]